MARCLEGLDRQVHPPEQVLAVVRREDGETMRMLADSPRHPYELTVVTVAEPGLVKSLNAGLAQAEGDILAVTDDDAVPRLDWLARLEDHFRARPEVGGVGGRDFVGGPQLAEPGPEGKSPRTVGKIRWYGRVAGNHHLGAGPPREVDVLKGANMSFRRSALRGIQVDERLRGSGAQVHFEIGLCLAVKRAGWELLYDPAVAVDHYPSQRFDEDQRGRQPSGALRDEAHNETYTLLRWLPWWRKVVALAWGLLVGSRKAPGALLAVERLLHEPDGAAVAARSRTALEGRLQGLATFGRALRDDRAGRR